MTFDLDFVSALSILAPTIVGTVFYSRLIPVIRILYVFVIITLALDILAGILFAYGINNMFLFHLYSFIEFSVIALIYYRLSPTALWRKLIIRFFIIFQTFSIVSLLFFENVTKFNAIQHYAEMLLLSLVFIAYMIRLHATLPEKTLIRSPFFILTASWLIYFSGTFCLFIYGDELLSDEKNNYWLIHDVFNIFLNVSYTFVLWLGRKQLSL